MKILLPLTWALLLAFPVHATAAEPGWVQRSNEHAQVLLNVIVQFAPEGAATMGIEGYDAEVRDLKPKVYERSLKATRKAVAELRRRLEKEKDPVVRQDLAIMIEAGEQSIIGSQLEREHLWEYQPITRGIFSGFRSLLAPHTAKERQAAAVLRLRRYAGLEAGYVPITELARARAEERMGRRNLVGPYRAEVEQYLVDSPRLLEGIRDLFEKSGLSGYEEPLATLQQQVQAYDEWVRAEVLPRARTEARLPRPLYVNALRDFGVDREPEEIMSKALVAFLEIRNEMETIAPIVARQKKLKVTDPIAVIRALKKKQLVGKRILPLYHERLAAIERIIEREQIVTLPKREAVIRLASAAESAMQPAPHIAPPRWIGNTGEPVEFVLPLVVPAREGEALRMDDFTFDAASWTLTAHEARPGHELQFSAMLEQGVSIARIVFAFNSTNAEGWGLYAESEMKPYLPLDGQLVSLQLRLLRAARAFLDPMVNLGLLQPEEAKRFLMEEVAMSEAMANQEVDRYTYRMPGQATSYFYGYQRLLELRQKTQLALRERFDRRAFHDFILSQGLLPPHLMEKAVMDDFVPRYRT